MRIYNIEALENNEQELVDGLDVMISCIELHKVTKLPLERYQALFQESERPIAICNSSVRLSESFGAGIPEL